MLMHAPRRAEDEEERVTGVWTCRGRPTGRGFVDLSPVGKWLAA